MSTNRLLVLVSGGIILLDMLWFLIRAKKNGLISKEQRTKRFMLGVISGYVFAVLLLSTFWFREFGLVSDVVLCGCCILAVELENRQLLGLIQKYDNDEDYK